VDAVKPIYKSFEGWKTSTRNISTFDGLPDKAQAYIRFIEEFTGVPFTIISTGPKRSETIVL
jgi:adenylosuccinate synthase